MCGIAGIINFGGAGRADASVVRQMCQIMAHRGPDDEGIYANGPVALGMRRLSIVDLATGKQPISNEDDTLWIVYNGEIYNHASLRERLESAGHRYKTHSDTETILHLYEEHGSDCLRLLRGMFAFAIWDTKKRRLFMARDRLGIKPFYYALTPQSLIFGSEIKTILACESINPRFDRAQLREYLAFGYLSGAETFYEGIRKLMPGHYAEVGEDGKFEISQYWDLPAPEHSDKSEKHYVQGYRQRLEDCVNSHLMSDVPIGVFLSGGLDSSVVAALMTKVRRQPVETFSVGYTENEYSELPFARIVAQHIGSRHHEVNVSCQDFFAALPTLIWHEDEPVAWPSSVALYFVARLAREHVKVVLTGEGSDETLAGYTRYAFSLRNMAVDRVYRVLAPELLRRSIRHSIATSGLISATVRRKLAHTFLGADGTDWNSFYFDNFFSAFGRSDQEELLSDECREGDAYEHVSSYWEQSRGDLLHRLLYTDIKSYLVELLMKQDNVSMAASIESRVPFLDHGLVEFAMTIPAHMQLRGLSGKEVLKKAAQDLLPQSIIRRPKLGFPTPWSGWLAGAQFDTVQDMLLQPRTLARGFFKLSAVEKILREHRAGYRDNYDRIWRLLNLELWHRVCLEGERSSFGGDAPELMSLAD